MNKKQFKKKLSKLVYVSSSDELDSMFQFDFNETFNTIKLYKLFMNEKFMAVLNKSKFNKASKKA